MLAVSPWIRLPQTFAHDHTRLFCLPHAGAGASAYRNWVEPARLYGLDVYAIQLPGRENRMTEPLPRTMAEITEPLAAALEPLLDAPYALFGHSLGALICFDLARALRRRGLPLPWHLFVSSRPAPQVARPHHRPVGAMSDDEFLAELRDLNGIPDELWDCPEMLDLLLPVLRADMLLNETYVYHIEPPLACPITAFGGTQEGPELLTGLEAWRAHTSVAFEVKLFPGGHFYLHSYPDLIATMAGCLGRGPSAA